jgi:hypothetical protein
MFTWEYDFQVINLHVPVMKKERTDGGSSVENEIEIDDAFFFFDTVDEPSDISNSKVLSKAAGE